MDEGPLPRFEATQRRAFLKGLVVVGAAGLLPGMACGNNDAQVFGKDTAATVGATTTAATTSAVTTTSLPSSDTGSDTEVPSTEAPTTEAPAAGGALPGGARLTVDFTYAVVDGGGGPARNPYIAVWVESAAGDLVRNISVWYESGRGDRWLNELTSWYSADQDYYDAHGSLDYTSVSGATRQPGSYSVAWDGADEAGARAKAGPFVVFIESAREHGTHSLTSAKLTLGSSAAKVSIPDQGDLGRATASYSV